MVWHFGVGIGFAILCGVAAYFSFRFGLTKLGIFCCVCGISALIFLAGETSGVKLGNQHAKAQQQVTDKFVNKTIKSTTTPKSRAAADPWDRKDY